MAKKYISASIAASISLAMAGTALAANEWDEIYLNNQYPGYTNAITGQHQYGRWTIIMTDGGGGINGILQENCSGTWSDTPTGWLEVNITSPSTTESQDYYMSGSCYYRVKLTVGSSGGKAFIRNWK